MTLASRDSIAESGAAYSSLFGHDILDAKAMEEEMKHAGMTNLPWLVI